MKEYPTAVEVVPLSYVVHDCHEGEYLSRQRFPRGSAVGTCTQKVSSDGQDNGTSAKA